MTINDRLQQIILYPLLTQIWSFLYFRFRTSAMQFKWPLRAVDRYSDGQEICDYYYHYHKNGLEKQF